jgi:hypothetical protein
MDATEAMSAEKYLTFVYALPVLRQVKMHLNIEDMFTSECPDENVKKTLKITDGRHLCRQIYLLWKLFA